MAYSLVFFKVALVLVNIRFICYVYKARDLRGTRLYIINTALENKIITIQQPIPHTYRDIVIFVHVN
jgi:hypothetical protein